MEDDTADSLLYPHSPALSTTFLPAPQWFLPLTPQMDWAVFLKGSGITGNATTTLEDSLTDSHKLSRH